jgi:hypothetical protein
MVPAEIGDAGMDADAAGVGPFVEHFKVAETGVRAGRRADLVPEADGHGVQG